MRSWLKPSGSSRPASILSSSRNASGSQVADPRDVEISDMTDAMEAAGRILNDDIDGAEAQLRTRMDSSSFHQLGLGVAVFMRSILGFEKDIMAEAASRLAECESRAWSDMKKAQKQAESGGGGGGWFRGGGLTSGAANVSGKGCDIYPPGTEFQLLNAEAQLMGAVISVMHESLTEGIKGFYKLRKAFVALDAIMEAEGKALGDHQRNGVAKPLDALDKEIAVGQQDDTDSDSDLDFVDAPEDKEQTQTPATTNGSVGKTNGISAAGSDLEKQLDDLSLGAASAPSTGSETPASQKGSKGALGSPPRHAAVSGPDSSSFTNPVDAFVHSGANMCFGVLLLLISMVPPAFSRLLYIIGFKGDRERGVAMLWQSTKFNNVNGGVAGLMLLGYYNGLLAFADILPAEDDVKELAAKDEIVGYPKEECIALLGRMRAQYPDSRMWKVEEARVLANARRLAEAMKLLEANTDSKMRQVTALNTFELSANALFMMRWETMRSGFLRCIELNDWSHSLYYYFVGTAELEMYRDCAERLGTGGGADDKERATLEADLRRHKRAAEEYFRKAPAVAGRKKFLARQMPFEVFALRKVAKWEARAKEWGCDLADAVGVSPGQEMTYLWTGSSRMAPETLEAALGCLRWERCTAPPARVDELRAAPDEAAIKANAEAALLRNLGRYEEARERLEPLVDQDRNLYKGENRDDWTLPCAHYELAALAWREGCSPKCWPSREDGKDDGEAQAAVDAYRRDKVRECEEYLEQVKTWESFVLDARLGMKVQAGVDTVAWLKKKKGWA